jgi:cyanoexosortase A
MYMMTRLFKNIDDRGWLFYSAISLAILYLNLTWKTTADLDRLTTESLFWVAILALLWRKRDRLNYNSDLFSSVFGFCLLGIILTKTLSLFWFESTLLPLIPPASALALALIASGCSGLMQYSKELFFAWFLFFPTGVIGTFADKLVHITLLNAKIATFLLYYFGFNVASRGNEVLLSLGEKGTFTAVVEYPCAGMPMILLMLKLALLLVCFVPLTKKQKIVTPLVSLFIGFILGVIRVCILTLMIPEPANFDYWHGSNGSQIFSTLAIVVFSGYCYWILEYRQPKNLHQTRLDTYIKNEDRQEATGKKQ